MRRTVLALVLALALAAPAGAAAQTAAEGYNSTVRVSATPPTSGPTSSSLPFTGFDAAMVAGGALLLLALGFALRKASGPGRAD